MVGKRVRSKLAWRTPWNGRPGSDGKEKRRKIEATKGEEGKQTLLSTFQSFHPHLPLPPPPPSTANRSETTGDKRLRDLSIAMKGDTDIKASSSATAVIIGLRPRSLAHARTHAIALPGRPHALTHAHPPSWAGALSISGSVRQKGGRSPTLWLII